MWPTAHSFVSQHPKFLGITGDSTTFAASILLALEALFKPTEVVSIGRKTAIVKRFKYAEDKDGKKLDAANVERKWLKLWIFANRLGAFALVVGFAFLLASRLWAE